MIWLQCLFISFIDANIKFNRVKCNCIIVLEVFIFRQATFEGINHKSVPVKTNAISSLASWLGNKTLPFYLDIRKIIGHTVSGDFLQASKILGDSLFVLPFMFWRFSSISVFMINKLQEVHCKLTEYYWRWFQYRFPFILVCTLKSKCLLFWKHLMNILNNLFYGYLGGFRERGNKMKNNYTLKTFFINSLLIHKYQ